MSTLTSAERRLFDALTGCLLGTAVGDALGLPVEGLDRFRQRRLFGEIDSHRLFFRGGMVSDDTEHTLMVARALIASGGDPTGFERALAREMKRWLLLLPAGVGLATLRAIGKLLVGISPAHSGVFSAGNGPAMRAAVLGVYSQGDLRHLRYLVRISTRLTHSDPRAEYGAVAVAVAASLASRNELTADTLSADLLTCLPEPDAEELHRLLARIADALQQGRSVDDFAGTLGLQNGVTGYIYHTVPVALYAALRHPTGFRQAVRSVIACGGDTDTTAAIVGGIVGAGVGKAGIPAVWLQGIREPFGPKQMESLAAQLDTVLQTGEPQRPLSSPLLVTALRNLLFLAIVLYHGFRRLLPPY